MSYRSRRGILQGIIGLGLTSCLGSFEVVHLNNAQPYEKIFPHQNISTITFAHLNAADLRGNTTFLFEFISEEEARHHAQWLGNLLLKEKVSIISLNEVDYAGTLKTGGLDQPKLIAEYMGEPYNYVLFDQYMESPLWTTGNAVISKFPMQAVHRHLYGTDCTSLDTRLGHLFKDFIHTEVMVGNKTLNIITTHLDDENEEYSFRRKEEAEELREYIKNYYLQYPDHYLVVAGDLNDTHDSKTMKMLLADGIIYPPRENFGLKTHQSGNPTDDLDHILASSNIGIHNYRTFQFPWSDHLGLICELELLE